MSRFARGETIGGDMKTIPVEAWMIARWNVAVYFVACFATLMVDTPDMLVIG